VSASDDVNLDIEDLCVRLKGTQVNVVDHVTIKARAGELLGLVGESGSGKTTVSLAVLGHARQGLEFAGGRVMVRGVDMLRASRKQLRRLRACEVAYVPQDPASALNPALRIGTQLREVFDAHRDALRAKGLGAARTRLAETLEEAGLGTAPAILDAYPHQLSGGQQQRVAIAMAFALRPSMIVLDEPTTGLDVTTQRLVLETITRLCKSYGVTAIYVSHDLAVVAGLADRLVVMYAGQLVEEGLTATVFSAPAHPYTSRLLRAVPSADRAGALEGIEGRPPPPARRPVGCAFAPRCSLAIPACSCGPVPLVLLPDKHCVRCLRAGLAPALSGPRPFTPKSASRELNQVLLKAVGVSAYYGRAKVLHDVSLSVKKGECVAVVGESGSGKTTLARCIVGMHRDWSGEVFLDGEALGRSARLRPHATLEAVQYIFQNPYTALNPRKTIGRIVEDPLLQFRPELRRSEREDLVCQALSSVALGRDFWPRYPDQLSGGERQRVAIARALIVSPKLLVCDEVTSSLDVSVQATIVELLRALQVEHHLSLLFITHNLALVRSIAQYVLVLRAGRVSESAPVEQIFTNPRDPYTVRLIQDAPRLTQSSRQGLVITKTL